NKQVYYSNYPYNTYREDVLNQIPNKSGFGTRNSLYTFHSPETDYSTKTNIPTELNVQGYQFGSSSGYFDDVEDHPKWTILSRKAYDTASTLATIEVAAEALIAMLTAQANVDAGWQNIVGGIGSTGGGTNWPGYAIQMAIATAIGAAM